MARRRRTATMGRVGQARVTAPSPAPAPRGGGSRVSSRTGAAAISLRERGGSTPHLEEEEGEARRKISQPENS